MLKAYKYRLYPNKEQEVLFAKHFGCARFIYNWGISLKTISYAKDKKSLSQFDLIKQIPPLKEEFEWLKEVNAQSLQQSIRNLDAAFNNFFRRKKEGNQNPGYPTYKKKQGRQSFQCPQDVKIDIENELISVPKIPNIKTRFSRTFQGQVKTTTISKVPSGKYFVSILVEDGKVNPEKPKIDPNQAIGLDMGINSYLTTSKGEKVENPKFSKKEKKKLDRLNRWLSRKLKGSQNWNKARIKIARIYEDVGNRRNDFLHKLSTKIVSENQTICFEDLNITGMLQCHTMAGSISDASWAMFIAMVLYKSDEQGKNVIKIGRFDPSSKICHCCGHYHVELKRSDKFWTCPKCGVRHDRDINAAINIKNFALIRQNLINQVPMDNREFTSVEILPLLQKQCLEQVGSKGVVRSRNLNSDVRESYDL